MGKKSSLVLAVAVTLAVISNVVASANAEEPLKQDVIGQTMQLGGAGSVVRYSLPDGSEMSVPQLAAGTDLNTLSDSTILALGLPPRPRDASARAEWVRDYSGINQGSAPAQNLQVPAVESYVTSSTANWGGYAVGTPNSFAKQYTAVKGNFTAPRVATICSYSSNVAQGLWVGIGGTNGVNDLVQQGIGCGLKTSTPGKWTPWHEFASTKEPEVFCNFSSWLINPGDVLYNNMIFQTSTNTAFFYLEDKTSGVKRSCSRTNPAGWVFTGNTAECINEKVLGRSLPNYGAVQFSNCQTQLSSNSAWIRFGSATTINKINNVSSMSRLPLQTTGNLGADGQSFTMTFVRAN